jgi:chromosomal replication initiation ATPase DnaA
MSGAAQLAFDLGHRPALGREDFLVAPSNEVAVAWIDRWPAWPGPTLALHGPAGCGKSHLCQVWRAANGAVRVDGAMLAAADPPALLGTATACALDDVEAALGDNDGRAKRLLHLYNMLVERGGHMLFVGRAAPSRWPVVSRDLGTRLASVPAIELTAPGDTLIEAVLIKLFADRQLRVGSDVVRFVMPRMERSFAAARALVEALDRAALVDRREITVPLARAVLADLDRTDKS